MYNSRHAHTDLSRTLLSKINLKELSDPKGPFFVTVVVEAGMRERGERGGNRFTCIIK